MRKSSLGRRSSTHIPVRNPSLGASGQRTCSGGKQGYLLKPGFSSQMKQRRSQSEDRDSYGGRPMSIQRSSTYGTLPGRSLSTMTPKTPQERQSVHGNLPSGSVRAARALTMSTESNRRMSSFGGAKNARKDARPISEKSFQQAAQAKIQEYLELYGAEVIGSNPSIRPMNTKLFVDIVDFLLKKMDGHIVITKSNYLEELIPLMRKIGYRLKIDKSWLMTVNTPHSWQHVVALLHWLVVVVEIMECVDPFEIMYKTEIPEPEEVEIDESDTVQINPEVVTYIKKVYRMADEPPSACDEMVGQMAAEFMQHQIIESKCTNEDLEVLQREIDLVSEELDLEVQRKDAIVESKQKLQSKRDALQSDCLQHEKFIEQSKAFIKNAEFKITTAEKEIDVKKTLLAKKQEEFNKLKEKFNLQKNLIEEKENMIKEKHDLLRMIQFNENAVREYEKTAFTVDLKFAEDQRNLDKLLLDYNKAVAEKKVIEPRLKDVEVKFTLLSKAGDASLDIVDANLITLINEYKDSLPTLEAKLEESDNILWRVKQDIKETEEEIAKETSLLEGIECDLKNQEDSINKETQKLKDECQRYQKMIKAIMEEISHFDQARFEARKVELEKIKHDHEVLKKRVIVVLQGMLEIHKEGASKTEVAMTKLANKAKEFKKDHL